MNSPEIMSAKMICRSIDNLAKEVRDLKRILLRKSDLVVDGKKMEGLEDDGLDKMPKI